MRALVLFVSFIAFSSSLASITIEAPNHLKSRIEGWMSIIASYSSGRETIAAIEECANPVRIVHNASARISAGRTAAPLSSNLTNGVGMPAEIMFDATIEKRGSHYTFDQNGHDLEFTAVQNLFHELSHARHYACGTYRYFDGEGQAIEDENRFRREQQIASGASPIRLRRDIVGCSYVEDREACLAFFED